METMVKYQLLKLEKPATCPHDHVNSQTPDGAVLVSNRPAYNKSQV